MRRIAYLLICLAALLLGLNSCEQQQLTREELLLTLDSLEHKFDWMDYRLALEEWNLYTTGESDSLALYQQLYNQVITDRGLFNSLRNSKYLLSDEVDKRRWDIISWRFTSGHVETNPSIVQLRDSLSLIDITHRAVFEGAESKSTDLYRIYQTDRDRQRREKAYRAWCSVGNELEEGLSRLFRLRNQLTRGLGYNDYMTLSFAMQDFNMDEYKNLLEKLDSLSEEPYRQVLDKIKEKLKIDQPEIWDLAYAYVDVSTEVDRYIPADSQMIFIRRSLKDIGFDLDKLPIYFDLETREGKSQYAYAFAIKPPYDSRVLANISEGLYSARILLHEIGHALHDVYIAQERSIFANSIDGCWSEGMAQTVAALIDEPKWLTTYAGMPVSLVNRHLAAQKEQNIVYLRTTLARLAFEYEAYSNPNRDLNQLYWDQFERYMSLPRHEDIKPWAAIIHYTTHPVYLQNYLYGDIIAAQTMDFVAQNYGDPMSSGNNMFKSFLVQNYFRFGGRYGWRELLKRGLDKELEPDALIRRLGIQ